MTTESRRWRLTLAWPLLLACTLAMTPVQAQDDDVLEEVTVTGSRIARDGVRGRHD